MASPTTSATGATGATQQGTTAGVGLTSMAPMPQAGSTAPQAPTLPDGIDPVLLARLHPDATSAEDAKAKAIAQGNATQKAGAETIASQQVPVVDPSNPPATK